MQSSKLIILFQLYTKLYKIKVLVLVFTFTLTILTLFKQWREYRIFNKKFYIWNSRKERLFSFDEDVFGNGYRYFLMAKKVNFTKTKHLSNLDLI